VRNFIQKHPKIFSLALALAFLSPLRANAQAAIISAAASVLFGEPFSLTGITTNAIAWGIEGLVWLLTAVVGIGFMFITWVIEITVALNDHIVNSPPVTEGFGVMLAVTNLGFVLAIVVIAITTILRIERYGIKQSLWRLFVAAALVNFSLPIAAPIIGFANELTSYFLEPVGGPLNIANSLAGASTRAAY